MLGPFNQFQTTGLFLYPLKASEKHRFCDVFRGCRKRPVAWNGVKYHFYIVGMNIKLNNFLGAAFLFYRNSDDILETWNVCNEKESFYPNLGPLFKQKGSHILEKFPG